MATPTACGAIALLWSAVPKLQRDIDRTLEILKKTARHQTSNLCGSSGSPNNVFGYGTIDIYKAYELASKMVN